MASTGVIGQKLPIEPIRDHVQELARGLSPQNHGKAANAIMTTDTYAKETAVSFTLDGKTCTVGGMAKGSGMIHPNMATTLNFVTTDVAISSEMIQKALSEIVKVTYNCLSIDGDTSTNDMVSILANGMAENTPVTAEGEDYDTFRQALYQVLMTLTKVLAKDGEGASERYLRVYLLAARTGIRTVPQSLFAKSVIAASHFFSVQCLGKMPTGDAYYVQWVMRNRSLISTKWM